MAPKRAAVPSDTFAKSPSALDKLTGRAHTENTATPQDRNTVKLHQGTDETTRQKITFYLRPDQIDKLDELVLAYKRQTGSRINRNELVRRLIDLCDLDLLQQASQRT